MDFTSLKEAVANKIKELNIIEDVINEEVKIEKSRRVAVMTKAYKKILELDKEYNTKLRKPDVHNYDENGNEVSSLFSKEKRDARNKNREAYSKLCDNLNKASEEKTPESFNNLEKAISKSGTPD